MKSFVTTVIAVAALVLALNADAIVAYSYDFNEGTGNVLNDGSGNGNNGTISGATWGAGTLIFDGVDDNVFVPYDASMNIPGPVQIEFRFKADPASAGQWNYIFSRSSVLAAWMNGNNWLASAPYYQGAGGQTHWAAVVADVWYTVKTVYDGADQITYLDGSEVARTAIGTDDVRLHAQNLSIGAWEGSTAYNFMGEIDYIIYQSYPIPEPGILLSGLALLVLRRKK